MRTDISISAFSDELQKIAQTVGLTDFNKSRQGRRPIRAHNLLLKGKHPEADKPDDAEERYKPPQRSTEYEAGSGMEEGTGNYLGG